MQTTTLGRLDLNFDILLQILSPLTRTDVAHLTRTCHSLRRALSAELPRGGVTLEGRHLTSFLIFADVKHGKDQLRYFQQLVLPGTTYDTLASGEQAMSVRDVRRALSTIFLAARSLESLFIQDLDTFGFRAEELKTILGSLPRLQELKVTGMKAKCHGALDDVLPRLRTLSLDFFDESKAAAFLSPTQTNLQDVTLFNISFKDAASASFPSVHTLRVSPVNFPSDIDVITCMFPNVKDVTFDFLQGYSRLDPEHQRGWKEAHNYSDSYKTWHDRLLSRRQRKVDAWPHIQTLRAIGSDVDKVFWVGLTCVVPRLELCYRSMTQRQVELAVVFNDLRPRCVVFHSGMFHGQMKTRMYGWDLLPALERVPSVTRLTIIVCQAITRRDSLAACLEKIGRALPRSSVAFLLLRLQLVTRPREDLGGQAHQWLQTYTGLVPSLRVLVVEAECCSRVRIHGWARKVRERRLGEWKEMSEDESRQFLAKEAMCPATIELCEPCERLSTYH